MIKKYQEFIVEGKNVNIRNVLTSEEIDDQFLRLEEVLGCAISWDNLEYKPKKKFIEIKFKNKSIIPEKYNKNKNNLYGVIILPWDKTEKRITKSEAEFGHEVHYETFRIVSQKTKEVVYKELENIKNRIENMYPIKMKIEELKDNDEDINMLYLLMPFNSFYYKITLSND